MDNIAKMEQLRLGVYYGFKIDMKFDTYTLRPLSIAEMNKVYNEVAATLLKTPENRRTKVMEDTLLAKEIIKVATRTYGQDTGGITDGVLDQMTNDQILFMYKEWLSTCERVNPNLETMPVDAIKALVDEVKKKQPDGLESLLTELSFSQLKSITAYLLTNQN